MSVPTRQISKDLQPYVIGLIVVAAVIVTIKIVKKDGL